MNLNFLSVFSRNKSYCLGLSLLIVLLQACTGEPKAGQSARTKIQQPTTTGIVNVYTNRYKKVDENLFKKFEQKSGLKINVQTDSPSALLERMKNETGKVSTDIVIFDDLTWMYEAKTAGLLQPFSSDSTTHSIPSRNADYQGTWIGLSKWALGYGCSRRAIPQPSMVNTYQDILDKQWKGRVLLTSAAHTANRFLVATMIAERGEKATTIWLKGLIRNLAMPPLDNEAALIKALAEGKGDISFLNASEHIRWTNSGIPADFKIGELVGVKTPFDLNNKTYYNITSAGLLLNAPNRKNAMQLIDFLVSKNSQQYYADYTFEYPVNVFALPSDFLMNIGGFQEKTLDFNTIASHLDLAKTLMKKAGWN